MKYFSKILVIISILMFACFATFNMSYAENTTTEGTSQTQSAGQIKPTVQDTSSPENEWLQPTNIINILLIAVGIVLILLAIAIFTRLKR